MSDDVSQYLNWLRFQECRPGFVNSYYFVELVSRVNELLKKAPCTLPVPPNGVYNVIEKELRTEEETGEPVQYLRAFLAESLGIALKEEFSSSDVYDTLQTWQPQVLVDGFKSPQADKFDKLPTEVKCIILTSIYRKIDATLPNFDFIGMDSIGNSFYVVGGRLYMAYDNLLKPARVASQKSPSEKKWKLMADMDVKWKRTITILESFGQEDIAKKISEKYSILSQTVNKEEEANWDASHLWLHVGQCRRTIAPIKVDPRKCKRDSICNNEFCEFNHYEQYHPITTKFENSHFEYARMRQRQVDMIDMAD